MRLGMNHKNQGTLFSLPNSIVSPFRQPPPHPSMGVSLPSSVFFTFYPCSISIGDVIADQALCSLDSSVVDGKMSSDKGGVLTISFSVSGLLFRFF